MRRWFQPKLIIAAFRQRSPSSLLCVLCVYTGEAPQCASSSIRAVALHPNKFVEAMPGRPYTPKNVTLHLSSYATIVISPRCKVLTVVALCCSRSSQCSCTLSIMALALLDPTFDPFFGSFGDVLTGLPARTTQPLPLP